MPSPRSPRSATRLRVTRPDPEPDQEHPLKRWLPWQVAAALAGLAAAAAGWLLATAIAGVGWVSAPVGGFPVQLGTQFWLLANGAGGVIDGVLVTLTPLGFTGLMVLILHWLTGWAARIAQPDGKDDPPLAALLGPAGIAAAGYLVPLLTVAGALGSQEQLIRAAIAGTVIAAIGALWGAYAGASQLPWRGWPRWLRAVPRAVLASLLVLTAAASAVLTYAVVEGGARMIGLADHLHLGWVGNLVMLLVQLAYLPNLLLWAVSYVLGAGFTLGDGSLVSPAATQLGLMPGIPVLAVVPEAGTQTVAPWLWLLVGVLAGAVAAGWVVQARPRARFDETALAGGLAGVGAAAVLLLFAWLSTGNLGTGRLVDLGPRLIELALLAPGVLGLSGVAVGLVWGLVRRPPRTDAAASSAN